ncbi:MAG: biotin/lipoyl-binding carrier protein [Nocardioides sp.]
MSRNAPIEIVAEMVANVLSVPVEVGGQAELGDTVVWLESMKMEIPVITESAGIVREVRVAAGDVVQEGAILLVLDPA